MVRGELGEVSEVCGEENGVDEDSTREGASWTVRSVKAHYDLLEY